MSQDPLVSRVRRVVHASFETAVSAAENVSGSAMLREAERELERVEDAMRRDRDRLVAKRDGAVIEQKARKTKATEMVENARYALTKGREDLATQAVAHQIDLEADADRLASVQAQCKVELGAVEEALAELVARREKMRRDVSAAAQSMGQSSSKGNATPQATVDAAIARANTIFERATGRSADPLHDPATARGMADINSMKRDDAIAERMAELKTKAATPPKRAAKR